MKLRAAFLFAAISCFTLFAQNPAPAPPQQSARQALIEMLTGGRKATQKHMTVEVQQLLAKSGAKSAVVLAMFDQVRQQAGSDMQTFDSGPLLLVINNRAEHQKLEVHLENDDLSGDEDTLELSLRVARENADQQPEEWESFLSRISVNMKKQAGIWRLNKVGAGVEFPLGDPEFLQKMFLKGMDQVGTGAVASGSYTALNTSPESQERKMPPEQLLMMVALAEYSYARQHPDIGFSCSLGDLAEASQAFGLGQQISSGVYQGYKLSFTGCQGHPVGSFQIVAEPLQGTGGKAFCTDATRNVRVADDGRGATCLAFGRVSTETQNDNVTGSFLAEPHTDIVLTPAPPKDQE